MTNKPFSIINEEIRSALRKPFPAEAVKQHPTKPFLSTIKAIYIIERLNDIFGMGNWECEHEIINDSENYVAGKGRLFLKDYKFYTPYQYGGHVKTGKNTEPADGYKSMVTDIISKCASFLEIGIDVFKGKGNNPNKQENPLIESVLSPDPRSPKLRVFNEPNDTAMPEPPPPSHKPIEEDLPFDEPPLPEPDQPVKRTLSPDGKETTHKGKVKEIPVERIKTKISKAKNIASLTKAFNYIKTAPHLTPENNTELTLLINKKREELNAVPE